MEEKRCIKCNYKIFNVNTTCLCRNCLEEKFKMIRQLERKGFNRTIINRILRDKGYVKKHWLDK